MTTLTNLQARQFMLLKHGLVDKHKFSGKAGVVNFVRQAGCIQYDPINVCGKNSELVLQSRVQGFSKAMLEELLYTDRALIDYPDKNLAIILREDWPYFERYRHSGRENAARYPAIQVLTEQVRAHIATNGAICSADLDLGRNIYWQSAIHWSGGNNVSRSVLEQMYTTGELVIHHKKGTRKYYDLAARHLPPELLDAPDPLPTEFEHLKWRIRRRIGAVGLLWDKPSDAWLNIWRLKADRRKQAIQALLGEEKLIELAVEGIAAPLYCQAEDAPLLDTVLHSPQLKPRAELIAPLDNFIWDRRLIKALFGFDYTWEIYTQEAKRRYGYYVLPLLYGERFIGRVEAVANRKQNTLEVKHIWYEPGTKQGKRQQAAVKACLERFAAFNDCAKIAWMQS